MYKNESYLLKSLFITLVNKINNRKTMAIGSINCKQEELDLGITLKGGQSFRWSSCDENKNCFRGVFAGHVWTLSQTEDTINYQVHNVCKKKINYEELLSNYFQLKLSLKENLKNWASVDSHFETSYDNIGAVRILNQDVVENLFSFICSSNNNIIRISGMVEKLCNNFGQKICTVDNVDYYDFPLIESLNKPNVESTLRKEGFGYRAGYISKTAEKLVSLGGINWLSSLKKDNASSYENAKEKLLQLPGVGPKVADCICLMSLGHMEAIPIDTHIFQVACANYMPHLCQQKTVTPKINQEISLHLRELWGPLAGWAQAVVFCVKINSNDRKGKKRKSSYKKISKKCKS